MTVTSHPAGSASRRGAPVGNRAPVAPATLSTATGCPSGGCPTPRTRAVHGAELGYGETQPVASDPTPEGWRQNRRVEIPFEGKA